MLAIKPTVSPVTPPPMLIIKSDLLKFLANNLFNKTFIVGIDFIFSLALKEKKVNLIIFEFFCIEILKFLGTPLSMINAIFFA